MDNLPDYIKPQAVLTTRMATGVYNIDAKSNVATATDILFPKKEVKVLFVNKMKMLALFPRNEGPYNHDGVYDCDYFVFVSHDEGTGWVRVSNLFSEKE